MTTNPHSGSPTVRPVAFLVVFECVHGREQQYTHELSGTTTLKIGRTSAGSQHGPNDVVLEAPFIGRDQIQIEPEGIGHCVVDLGGANKFHLHGQPISTRYSLRDGDVLRLYSHIRGDYVTLTYRNTLLAHMSTTPTNGRYELDAGRKQVTIGRLASDVVLDHPTISRTHAVIECLADGSHAVRDADSANGTFVNGTRLIGGTAQRLNPNDVVQVGPFKLTYRGTTLERQDQRGAMRIDVRNLTFTVPGKDPILKNVSLSIAPREFVALVGGSGAGKSSLMKSMLGFTRATSGNAAPVLVNGDDYYEQFDAYRAELGYVPQDDILHANLPLRSALTYSARLRLPPDTTTAEIEQRIDQALRDVDMADPKHRGKLVYQLSGGQRKRVSIAAELLAEPSLFYLDEPTSGLDPGLEMKMMETLRHLADSGRTVVLVTHATANIKLCDHVAFMADGRLVYYGPPREAPAFFGVARPNGAEDDFAEIYNRLNGDVDANHPLVQSVLGREYAEWRATHPNHQSARLSELWEARYRQSHQQQLYVTNRQNHIPTPKANGVVTATRRKPLRTSGFRQYRILTMRYFDIILRDQRNLLILLLQSPIIALMLVILTRTQALVGIEDIEKSIARIEAQNVLFMLVATGVWFGIINAAREITKETPIYRRERLSNLRIGPYLFSKISVLLGLILIQNVALFGILATRVEFPLASQRLLLPPGLEMFVTMMLVSLAGTMLGLLISAWSSTADQAISVVPLVLIPQLLFAGLIFKIEPGTLVELFSWLMISRWGIDALGTTTNANSLCQLPNVVYEDKVQSQCRVTTQLIDDPASKQMLERFPFVNQGLTPSDVFASAFLHSAEHLLFTWGILCLFVVGGGLLTAWRIRRRDKER